MEARPNSALSLGLLVLRVGMGGYLFTHGLGKLQMLLAGQAEQLGDPIGIGSTASLWLITVAELVCPVLVIVGLATRLAAILPVIAMSVAAIAVHGADPWTMGEAAQRFMAGESPSWASKEPALLFLVGFLTLVLTGPGRYALDARLAARRQR